MPDPFTAAVAGLELAMLFAGLVLLWKLVLSPTARRTRTASPLVAWNAPLANFIVFILAVFAGTILVGFAGAAVARQLALTGDRMTVFNGAAAQIGMLAGVAFYHFKVERIRSSNARGGLDVFKYGLVTFLIALPVLAVTSLAWQVFLDLTGLPAERQDLIRMFSHADSFVLLGTMTVLAVVVAPVTEELIFRAGLFRYFRTRMPRVVAMVAPAVFFALLHVNNWETLEGFASIGPLAMLAVVFSVAYERTGRIGTCMVAHGLFNLNTIVVIFSGLDI